MANTRENLLVVAGFLLIGGAYLFGYSLLQKFERLVQIVERTEVKVDRAAARAAPVAQTALDKSQETLQTIAAGAVGTEIVLSYSPPRAGLDELSQAFFDIMVPLAESRGEPIQSFFEEPEIEDLVRRCGLEVVDHPSHVELNDRYLSGRADGLRTYMCERMLTAVVA